jgi:hypothetical protein
MKILKITCIPFWQSIIAIWFFYDMYIEPTHPPREKSYSKATFDISKVSAIMKLSEFKKTINDYISITSHSEHYEYMYADDGFFRVSMKGIKR